MSRTRPSKSAPLKRLIDIVLAGGGLVALSPVLLVLWILVRRRMGSPPLFRQVRPGLHGRPFTMVKFRTMRDATDADGRLLSDAARLTDFGKWLRATSLDELPELWNVLKGDMSLVGPRPLLMDYLPYYCGEERLRHSVRPGITGYAQLKGRNSAHWDERLANDVWYVHNRSLGLDLKIMWATIGKVVRKDGVAIDPRGQQLDLNVERARTLPLTSLGPDAAADLATLFQSTLSGSARAATMIGSPYLAALISEVLMETDLFVGIRHEQALVAAVHLRRLPGSMHINYIAVDEAYRGGRLAERLIRDGLDRAGGLPLSLDVDVDNAAALRLYARMGFEPGPVERRVILQGRTPVPAYWEGPQVAGTLADYAFFARYGIGRLRLPGDAEATVTVVWPGHLRLPLNATDGMLASAESLPCASISVPASLAHTAAAGRIVTKTDSIRMTLACAGTERA